jgi:hypothetical protein
MKENEPMAKTRYYLNDEEISEAEAFDANGMIKDGVAMRTPAFLRDGWPGMRDSRGVTLKDAFGAPIEAAYGRRGYVFVNDAASAKRKADAYVESKLMLSSAYKGGWELGDTVTVGDATHVITDAEPTDTGYKVTFKNTARMNAEDAFALKEAARDESIARMNDAWKRSSAEAARDEEDEERRKRKDREFELAGPLSDSKAQQIKDAAYNESVTRLQDAWRR